MKETTKLPEPAINELEREQNIGNLVQRLREYYCQSREETLRTLAVTVEDVAFRQAHSNAEYVFTFASLSEQEVSKATQVHDRVNATDLTTEQRGTRRRRHWEMLTPENGNCSSDELSENEDKARQQAARRKIVTRRRRCTRRNDASKRVSTTEAQLSPAKGEAEHETGCSSEYISNNELESVITDNKKHQPVGSIVGNRAEGWTENFFGDAAEGSVLTSPFSEELPDLNFEGYDETETSLSFQMSSGYREPLPKKRRTGVECLPEGISDCSLVGDDLGSLF